jgi:hypothetical protein
MLHAGSCTAGIVRNCTATSVYCHISVLPQHCTATALYCLSTVLLLTQELVPVRAVPAGRNNTITRCYVTHFVLMLGMSDLA